jgi:hypothetical protein
VLIYYDGGRTSLFHSAIQFLEVVSSTLPFNLPSNGHEEVT